MIDFEILSRTLKNYFPSIKKKKISVLDAMCGFWSYSKNLSEYFNNKYEIDLLMGVEKDFFHKDYSSIFQKPLEYKGGLLVEELPKKYDEYFDAITNFRPMCTSKKLIEELQPAYKRIKQLMKKNGIFFATTYNQYEMENLSSLLKDNDFKIMDIQRNAFDSFELHHGWVIIAH